ncbi:TetR/AcrR family transcriptional regulator [Frankia nepalensis]|uniref:TetR/AcrR family transcriptional regulator n=1 Tax=Frankia nepalensis TaxID=1836974 RepID=UPI0027DBF607|nr:TetR/AcrR family transcriptional regulator [Frankia nepalensis]
MVLQSAISNFARVGYHGTSMRDIAGDAGMTVATIYHHFASKQEILQAIMAATLRDVIALTRRALVHAGGSPAEQLTALVSAWILFHTDRQAEALIGASELRSLDTAGRRLIVALRDEQEAMFRDVIEHGTQRGEFLTPYPVEAARAIINMGYSVAAWYRAGAGVTPAEMAARYCELALGVVRGPRTPTP